MTCYHCGEDIVKHHHRNLKCPGDRKTIFMDASGAQASNHGVTKLPDGSAFFVAEVNADAPPVNPVMWNPFNKVVQDHRDGTIHREATDVEREKRGLKVPWTPALADIEVRQRPVL